MLFFSLFFRSNLQIICCSEYDDPEKINHGYYDKACDGICRVKVDIDCQSNDHGNNDGHDIQHDRIDKYGSRFP